MPPSETSTKLVRREKADIGTLEAKAEARSCLEQSKRSLEPMNVQGAIHEIEVALA